jgi:uncharacterized damage-inducible protein DinB
MSFADIAKHLIDCDKELIRVHITKYKSKQLGKSKSKLIKLRDEFDKLITALDILKTKRRNFILSLNNELITGQIQVDSIAGKKKEYLGLLVHRMLDHEAHHRGQISVLLKFVL